MLEVTADGPMRTLFQKQANDKSSEADCASNLTEDWIELVEFLNPTLLLLQQATCRCMSVFLKQIVSHPNITCTLFLGRRRVLEGGAKKFDQSSASMPCSAGSVPHPMTIPCELIAAFLAGSSFLAWNVAIVLVRILNNTDKSSRAFQATNVATGWFMEQCVTNSPWQPSAHAWKQLSLFIFRIVVEQAC